MSRRGIGSLLVPSAACLALAAAAGRPDDPPGKGPAELQGCWKLVSVEAGGNPVEPVGGGEPRLVVKGDRASYGGAEVLRLAADPSTSPRVVDLTFRDPDRVYEGIYAVEKDTLKVCLNARADAKDRPGGFSTRDQPGWRLLVFEREKAAPANPTEGLTAFVGVQLRADKEAGVVVDAPLKGSPAEKAGLKKGDVVLAVGGAAAADVEGTVKLVRRARPGDRLGFRVRRAGAEVDVTVTVGVFPFPWVVGLE